MSSLPRPGRPRASSREILAEAACELFLERGFDQTSIADITARAGVSRSSFFNYFASKSDILWAGLDERIAALEARLRDSAADASAAAVGDALAGIGDGFAPDSLALALVNAAVMGLDEELEREASLRRSRIARAVAARLVRDGMPSLEAEVAGAAHGGAVIAAVEAWAGGGAGRAPLSEHLAAALRAAGATLPAGS